MVPNCSATWRAWGSSSNPWWSKPIENVRTGSADCCAIAATTAEESIPPERKAPSGTSEIMRRLVAVNNPARSRSQSSSTGTSASFAE